MLHRGSSAKSARWGGDREEEEEEDDDDDDDDDDDVDDDDDDDDGNGVQGYRAAMKGGRFHYSASIECDKRN